MQVHIYSLVRNIRSHIYARKYAVIHILCAYHFEDKREKVWRNWIINVYHHFKELVQIQRASLTNKGMIWYYGNPQVPHFLFNACDIYFCIIPNHPVLLHVRPFTAWNTKKKIRDSLLIPIYSNLWKRTAFLLGTMLFEIKYPFFLLIPC